MDVRSQKVLILNADYRALSVCNVYKAFVLVYLEKASMVDSVKEQYLRTVDSKWAIPTVIKLNRYINKPYKGVMLTRQNIFKRDKQACVYCGSKSDLTLDHVLPRSRGGKTSWTNLVAACKKCNSRKGDSLPEEANMPLPYKPYKPSFILFLRDTNGLIDETWQPFLS